MYGYTLFVYKQDRRCKTGERLLGKYPYRNYSGNAMMEEMKDLYRHHYKRADGYRLDFEFGVENSEKNG